MTAVLAAKINQEKLEALVEKYGGIVPRYTSYPTAPEWKDEFSKDDFEAAIKRSNQEANDISLYLHIPFCESQCYYCGCNVIISPEHGIEHPYLARLKEEIDYISKQVDKSRVVRQIAWGGGTPTYISPEQILELFDFIRERFTLLDEKSLAQNSYKGDTKHEYAIEIDPRVTSKEHLEALYEAGFNRLSMGIQDFNPATQEAVNRIQSFEMVSKQVAEARAIGFKSINFDLIYGLPLQSLETFKDTIEKVKQINPERIALFNYAHIPSMFPFQRKYIKDEELPEQKEKTLIFDYAVEQFTDFGYEFIGLDHFAKPEDELAIAQRESSLYRNFQGYTTFSGCDLFGMGVTAISDVAGVYKQNYKKLNDYNQDFGANKFKLCSEADRERREIIKQIMCNGKVLLDVEKYSAEIERLAEFMEDDLLSISSAEFSDLDVASFYAVELTETGRLLVRNIAAVFDQYINKDSGHKLFSKSL